MNDVLNNLPDISFIDNLSVDELIDQMVSDYLEKYEEVTGKKMALSQADPYRIILYACALQIYQILQYTDRAGKNGMLKYSYGDFLDNLGALKKVTRLTATPACTKVQFEIAEVQTSAVSIPKGTRVTRDGTGIYFATNEYAEVAPGATSIEIECTCTTNGTAGNGFRKGEITTLVDVIPYISSVLNITETGGGCEIESDESLAERIYLSPSASSTAGAEDAYIYWAKTANSDIADVKVSNPSEGEVDVRFILNGGKLPDKSEIQKVEDILTSKEVRPLTDHVTVDAPETVQYDISLTYFINESSKGAAGAIQEKVNRAVESYKTWQSEKIGRDINPSYLISKVMAAGAKRVEISKPTYTSINDTDVALLKNTNVTYGGIEDD